MRFNPPPNWPPVPPGWTPPPNWQPDPTWPPPPLGWQLWVPDQFGPAPAGRNRTLFVFGGIAAAIVVVVGVVLALVLMSRSDSGGGGGGGSTTSAQAASDEEEIQHRIDDFENAWNDKDFDAISAVVCDELHDDPEFTEEDFLTERQDAGRLKLTATEFDVNGDKAVVSIEQAGQEANDFDFVRENGEWKWCEL